MSIAVTVAPLATLTDLQGVYRRRGNLVITGLSEGANTVPHGLGFIPKHLTLRPTANGLWGETQVPDVTNIYITVGTGGATGGNVGYEE